MNNYTIARFKSNSLEAQAAKLTQYDYGQSLKIVGLDLPSTFEAHFAASGANETITALGTNNMVAIPNQCLKTYGRVKCYIYLHAGETDGKTCYKIYIPVEPREKPSDIEPTPDQQNIIDQLIEALDKQPKIIDGYWYIWSNQDQQYENTGIIAGFDPNEELIFDSSEGE